MLLSRRRADIERRWSTRANKGLPAAMPAYLDALSEALAHDLTPGTEARAWARAAREHALTRVREGFDVDEVVHELALLRQVLLEVACEDHQLADMVSDIERVVDVPIEAAVRSYVDARDYQIRRSEAEHIFLLTHQLRNPLAIATLAAAQLEELVGPAQKHTVELIRRSLSRLGRLIESGLDAELLHLASQESRPVFSRLGAVMDDSLHALRASAADRGVELDLRYDPSLRVWLDPLLTATALRSLLDHLVRYSDGGTLRIDALESPEALYVDIRDTQSLSEEELRALFEPARRTHGALAARRALEAQGGSIRADSLGDGTHFRITLPKVRH
jgi:signal transduction histidine kinase